MNKPNLVSLNTVPSLNVQQYERYNPTAFNDSLSILEKINKMIYQLNDFGKISNDLVKQWNELIQWILNNGLEEIVSDEIDKRIEDGTFNDLFNSILGDLALLETTDKTTIVNAINEVFRIATKNELSIGDLELLKTLNKDDLVSAINELKKQFDVNEQAVITIGEATGYGIISGFKVMEQDVLAMAVKIGDDITPNIIHMKNGVRYVLPSVQLSAVPSHSTLNRLDYVIVTEEGEIQYIKGVASLNPVLPNIPESSVILASVKVSAGDETINDYDITDLRQMKSLVNLKTNNKANFVQAINEIFNEIELLSDVVDGDKTELIEKITQLEVLLDATKIDLQNMIGDLLLLQTTDKSNIVNAINEVLQKTESQGLSLHEMIQMLETEILTVKTSVGNLDLLQTIDKTNIVSAINEVIETVYEDLRLTKEKVDTDIGNLQLLDTVDKSNLVNAINEVLSSVANIINVELGDITNLKTKDKTNVVSAINELVDETVKKNEQNINVLDYGLVGDGVTDNTLIFNQLLSNHPDKSYYFPDGVYKINGVVSSTNKINLISDGNETIFDLTEGGQLLFQNSISSLPNLSLNINEGDNVVTFINEHNLKKGDVFIAYNPSNSSWASYRTYYRDGCMFEVDNVLNSTSVRVLGVSPDTYNFNRMNMYKINGQGVAIKGFKILPSNSNEISVWLSGHKNIKIENLEMHSGSSNTGVDIELCYDVILNECRMETFSGESYPLAIANSQNVEISNGFYKSARHGIALGGRDKNGAVPTRNVLINNVELINRSDSGVGAADMHGNCVNIIYSNCIMNTCVHIGGKDVKYQNCKIVGRNPSVFSDGICAFGSEIVGGNIVFEGCEFTTFGSGNPFGVVALNTTNRTKTTSVIISNCTFNIRKSATTLRCVAIENNSNSLIKLNVIIRNSNVVSDDSIFAIVRFNGVANIKDQTTLCIDNIIAPKKTTLVSFNNADDANMKMRLPTLTGSTSVEANSGTTSTITSAIDFYYIYPRKPQPAVVTGNETPFMVNGNKILIAGVYQITNNSIRLYIASGDQTPWSATTTNNINWSISLSDF